MPHWPSLLHSAEVGDLAAEVQRLFDDLERERGRQSHGQCTPSVDVLETDETFEVVVDLPGVPRGAIRVLLKGGIILVAGEKPEGPVIAGANFHLVERGSGRFARAVRIDAAFDGSRASARLTQGELRIVLPRIYDRRGRPVALPVEDGE